MNALLSCLWGDSCQQRACSRLKVQRTQVHTVRDLVKKRLCYPCAYLLNCTFNHCCGVYSSYLHINSLLSVVCRVALAAASNISLSRISSSPVLDVIFCCFAQEHAAKLAAWEQKALPCSLEVQAASAGRVYVRSAVFARRPSRLSTFLRTHPSG